MSVAVARSPSPEERLVLATCRTPMTGAARRRAEALLDGPLDWQAVFACAGRWQVEPVAFTNLLAIAGEALPQATRQEATTRCWTARARSWKLTTVLLDLLRLLEGAGIPVIVLKGPAIGLVAYGDVTMRTFNDLDLLVQPADVRQARSLLVDAGYRAYYDPRQELSRLKGQHPLEFSDGRTHVDLHTTLFSRYLKLDIDAAAAWRDARTVPCLDSTIRVLARHHLYVYLCAHGAKHQWQLFRWVCDVAQLDASLEPTDVERITALATTVGARRLVALGTRLAGRISGGAPTNVDADRMESEAATRALVRQVETAWFGAPARGDGGLLAVLHPSLRGLGYWMAARERVWDRLIAPMRLAVSSSARDARAGSLRGLWRPLRLAAGVVQRAVLHR
ncbi:hypothetical protein tb265_15830 [Gemmatimonadetes bacterium T265]|nr:hypothetical protein tb265_15830 [Gemmatimonadetes bacterium T265]